MSISTVSFTRTPQAGDDIYGWSEDALIGSGLLNGTIVTLNVMANDLGGNAKRLWSIDDGNGHTSQADYDLLNSDMGGVWENAAVNNLGVADQITISNGQVLLDLTRSLQALGATSVQALAAGDHIYDQFVYSIRLANGTLSQATVTVDLYGENDAASISGDHTGSVTEDQTLSASGTLTVVDSDHGQSHTATATNAPSDNGLGTYSVDATGHWSYNVNNALVQHLGTGDTVTDTFTVTSLDGTASQQVTITIHGASDRATFSGDDTGAVTEDTQTSAHGTLSVSDVDDNQSAAQTASGSTALGGYSVAADGSWTYNVHNAAIQHLGAGDTAGDSFDVVSADGTHHTVNITIHGANDPATFSGDDTGAVTEDTQTSTQGTLSVSDVDDNQSAAQTASGSTALGGYSVAADGSWTYNLNNALIQHLGAGDTAGDSFDVVSADGTHHTVNITIHGANDPATFSGDTSGSATEDDTVPATGTLAVSDVDDGEAHTIAASGAGGNNLGSYTVDADGHWTYTVANQAVQHLGANDTAQDTFTVTSFDGTASQQVTITVTGANDPPAAAPDTDAATEGGAAAIGSVATNDSDPDYGAVLSYALDAPVAGLSLHTDGSYSFDPTDPAYNHLAQGITADVVAHYTVSDEHSASAGSTLTITVTGSNDAPVAAADTDAATEGGAAAIGSVATNDSDPDYGAVLSYALDAPVAGLTFHTDGSYSFDPTDPAYNHLAQGITADVVAQYTVSDEHNASAGSTLTITMTGVNDAPAVSGAVSGSATEDASTSTLNALANASDVDDNTTLSIVGLPLSLPAGVSYDAATHSFTLDPANAAFQHLAQGTQTTVTVNYGVSDGIATTPASVSWTVTGVNDPATFGGQDTGLVTEAAGNNGGIPTATGALSVSDPDDNQSSFQAQNNAATSYGHFTLGTNGSWNYTLDNTNATVNALNNGQTLHDLIGVQSFDGTHHTVDITINGVTDDLGGPTGIGFSMIAQSGNSLANLGTFFQTGDPDPGDTFAYSIGAGSAGGFVLTAVTGGASLNASGAATNTEDLLNVVATDAAGNSTATAFHVWIGTNGADTHTALFSTNNIDAGQQGTDILRGSNGTDYLFGGNGNDFLQGNGGADFLSGGGGTNTFAYGAVNDFTAALHDLILDFTPGSDIIDLSAIDANLTLANDQPFTFDSVQNSGTVAGHVTWSQDAVNNETIIHAGVVGDGTLEIHLSGLNTLTTANFAL